LFGVLGLLTASAIVGIWSWWRAAKKGSQQGEKTGKKMPKKPTTPKRPGRKKRL
jgi:TfoX/Sxy family transcriptional regulator of competence genes